MSAMRNSSASSGKIRSRIQWLLKEPLITDRRVEILAPCAFPRVHSAKTVMRPLIDIALELWIGSRRSTKCF